MLEGILTNIASGVLTDIGKRAVKDYKGFFGKLRSVFPTRRSSMVFVPEAAGLNHNDKDPRKLFVRLILFGSASWTKGKPVTMRPTFTVTLFPPGSDRYTFSDTHSFTTPPVKRGMHSYYLGEQILKEESLSVEPCGPKVGLIFSGDINVEGLGTIPIFPVTLLAGCMGGFVNEPLELAALKKETISP